MSAVGVTLPQTYRLNYALQQSVSDAQDGALKLATQQNILHPSEGPSELAIYSLIKSEKLSTEAVLSSVEQCTMITTSAESSIRDLQGIIMRQYELAARAVNVFGDNKKIKLIDAEFQQLNSEINRIVSSTTVNGIKILKDITGGSNFVTDTTGTIKGTQSSVTVPITTDLSSKAPTDKMIQINGINMYLSSTASTAAITKRTTQEICFDVADFSGAGKSASGTICTLTLVTTGTDTKPDTKPITSQITIGVGTGDINVPASLLTDVSSKVAADNIANTINTAAGSYYKADGTGVNPYYGLTARVTDDNKLAISYISDISNDGKFTPITNITLEADLTNSTTITDGIVCSTNNTCNNVSGSTVGNTITATDNGSIGQSFVLKADTMPDLESSINSIFGVNGSTQISGIIPINKSILGAMAPSFDSSGNLILQSNASTMAGDILVLKNTGATNNIYVTNHDGNKVGSLGVMNAGVSGNLGNNLIAPIAGAKGTTGIIAFIDGDILEGTKLTIGSGTYTFTADPIISQGENFIQLIDDNNGKTNIKQTLMQLYNKFNISSDPFIKNLEFNVSNDTLTISTRVNTNHYNGLTVNFDTQHKSGTILNGYANGIDVSGLVDNQEVIGKILPEDIKVSYAGQNNVNIAISFGSTMFSCNNLNPQNIGTYRFDSNQGNGSYIDITFAMPEVVNNAPTTQDFEAKLSTALTNVSFFQRREISNFDTTNLPLLMNAKAEFNTDNNNPNIAMESITVTSADSDSKNQAFITMKTNDGFTYKNVYENDHANCMIFNAGSSIELIGTDKYGNTCLNNKIILTFGNDINFITDESVAQLQTELTQAFKAGQDGVILAVSSDLKQKIIITIPDLSTNSLYGKGILPNVATKQDAENTAGLVSKAIEIIVSALCEVGAYQSRMAYIIQSLSGDVESLSSAMDVIMLPDTPTITSDITNSIALIKATIFSMTQMRQINDALSRLIS